VFEKIINNYSLYNPLNIHFYYHFLRIRQHIQHHREILARVQLLVKIIKEAKYLRMIFLIHGMS
jgi:hypothetical protein